MTSGCENSRAGDPFTPEKYGPRPRACSTAQNQLALKAPNIACTEPASGST